MERLGIDRSKYEMYVCFTKQYNTKQNKKEIKWKRIHAD